MKPQQALAALFVSLAVLTPDVTNAETVETQPEQEAPDHGPVPTEAPSLVCDTTSCRFSPAGMHDGWKWSNSSDPGQGHVPWYVTEAFPPPGSVFRVRSCVGAAPYPAERCGPAAEALVPNPPDPYGARRFGATGAINGYPCGGQLPPCWVLNRESHGNPLAENPSSTASGLWQFLDSTWAGYAGVSHASHASPLSQNERAASLWAGGAGCSHWQACD